MDDATDECEECVILADADVLAGHDSRSALTNDDLAGPDFLSITALNTKIFWI